PGAPHLQPTARSRNPSRAPSSNRTERAGADIEHGFTPEAGDARFSRLAPVPTASAATRRGRARGGGWPGRGSVIALPRSLSASEHARVAELHAPALRGGLSLAEDRIDDLVVVPDPGDTRVKAQHIVQVERRVGAELEEGGGQEVGAIGARLVVLVVEGAQPQAHVRPERRVPLDDVRVLGGHRDLDLRRLAELAEQLVVDEEAEIDPVAQHMAE